MIEQHRLEFVFEGRLNKTPHMLVAAETVGEHHRLFSRASNTNEHVFPSRKRGGIRRKDNRAARRSYLPSRSISSSFFLRWTPHR